MTSQLRRYIGTVVLWVCEPASCHLRCRQRLTALVGSNKNCMAKTRIRNVNSRNKLTGRKEFSIPWEYPLTGSLSYGPREVVTKESGRVCESRWLAGCMELQKSEREKLPC